MQLQSPGGTTKTGHLRGLQSPVWCPRWDGWNSQGLPDSPSLSVSLSLPPTEQPDLFTWQFSTPGEVFQKNNPKYPSICSIYASVTFANTPLAKDSHVVYQSYPEKRNQQGVYVCMRAHAHTHTYIHTHTSEIFGQDNRLETKVRVAATVLSLNSAKKQAGNSGSFMLILRRIPSLENLSFCS